MFKFIIVANIVRINSQKNLISNENYVLAGNIHLNIFIYLRRKENPKITKSVYKIIFYLFLLLYLPKYKNNTLVVTTLIVMFLFLLYAFLAL